MSQVSADVFDRTFTAFKSWTNCSLEGGSLGAILRRQFGRYQDGAIVERIHRPGTSMEGHGGGSVQEFPIIYSIIGNAIVLE